MGPGEHFGELAALAEAPRSVTVTAETQGVIARCPPEAFKAFILESGAPAYALAVTLARTIVSLTDRLFEASLEVRLRICAQLLRLLKSGEPTDGGIVIRNAPTHAKIGEAAGTNREAVTKEFSHLAALGILRQNKRELILDAEKLRELVRRQAGLTASQLVDW